MSLVNDTRSAVYQHQGYLVVEKLLLAEHVESLRERMAEIAEGRGQPFPEAQIEFEPNADGIRSLSTVRKINQCARHDERFMAHARCPQILDIVEQLIGPDIKLYGSQCFMKPAGGIEKPYHQDSAYFTIDPAELVTCWAALDDTTIDNGCLWFIPGSHRGPILDHDQPWQVGERIDMQIRDSQIDVANEVAVELAAGSVSFHHSRLLHRSGPNRTACPRRGLAVHYMSAQSRWTHPTAPKPDYVLLRGREYPGCV